MQSRGLMMLIRTSLLLVALAAPCGDAFMHFPAIARPSSPSTRSYFSAASKPAAPVHGTLVSRNAVKEMTRRTAEAMSEEKGRAEFELNRGQAVDTLLNDYTTLYKDDPDFSIFTQDVVLRDVQVVQLPVLAAALLTCCSLFSNRACRVGFTRESVHFHCHFPVGIFRCLFLENVLWKDPHPHTPTSTFTSTSQHPHPHYNSSQFQQATTVTTKKGRRYHPIPSPSFSTHPPLGRLSEQGFTLEGIKSYRLFFKTITNLMSAIFASSHVSVVLMDKYGIDKSKIKLRWRIELSASRLGFNSCEKRLSRCLLSLSPLPRSISLALSCPALSCPRSHLNLILTPESRIPIPYCREEGDEGFGPQWRRNHLQG